MEETEFKNSWNGSRGGNRGGKNRGGKRNRGRYYSQGNSMGGGFESQNMEASGSNGGNFDFRGGYYDQSQFGEMMYQGNMNQMPRNQWEVSYPINTRFMGYRPENTDYSYFGPYNNPSNDYGGFRGMNATSFEYPNRYSDGYDMTQDYNFSADYGFNNFSDAFHMPSRPGGGPFHSRRGNHFPPRGRGRGRFSRSKSFHSNRQGKKKKKKPQDSAAPKHVFAKKPWFDDAILKLLKEKIKAHKRMKRSPSKSNIEAFKELRKEVRRISRQSYNDYCLKSGLPNKYLEAAKAKRQKAEEAASKAEDNGEVTINNEQGEENENNSNAVNDQNENAVNERSEVEESTNDQVNENRLEEETEFKESVNDNEDKNNGLEEEEKLKESENDSHDKENRSNNMIMENIMESEDQDIQNTITDRLETEFTNGNEELNQNRPIEETALQNENFEEMSKQKDEILINEQAMIRQALDTEYLNMESDINERQEDNSINEATYETSESIVS